MNLKSIFNLLVCLISTGTIAQGWHLIDENKVYFFRHSDSLHITNTIKTDSSSFISGDSIFHIHTRLKLCDTCTVFPPGVSELYHALNPEFFGQDPFHSTSTGVFSLDGNIVEYNAQVSDSWTFNTSLGINATAVSADLGLIFGELDSVKIIQLSTLDTLMISKNHGVMRYPDFENPGNWFEQVGYHEGQNSFGEYLPNFWRIYDFEAGDVFCYDSGYQYDGGGGKSNFQIKMTILENLSNTAAASYRVRLLGYKYNYYFDAGIPTWVEDGNSKFNYTDTFITAFDNMIFESQYSGFCSAYEPWPSPEGFYHYPLTENCFWPDLLTVRNKIATDNSYVKYAANVEFFAPGLVYYDDDPGYYSEFQSGHGRIFADYFFFELSGHCVLVGYIEGSDTTGTIFNFPDDLSSNSVDPGNVIISPNPATDIFRLNLPIDDIEKLEILDPTGKLWLQKESNFTETDISELPGGFYVVRITVNNCIWAAELIKN